MREYLKQKLIYDFLMFITSKTLQRHVSTVCTLTAKRIHRRFLCGFFSLENKTRHKPLSQRVDFSFQPMHAIASDFTLRQFPTIKNRIRLQTSASLSRYLNKSTRVSVGNNLLTFSLFCSIKILPKQYYARIF